MRFMEKRTTYKSGRELEVEQISDRWVGVCGMASPNETLLVEQISYAEEALERLKERLRELLKHIEYEHQRVLGELKTLEEMENEIDTETFDRISWLLQDAWTKAMSACTRLQDLDKDLSECDIVMSSNIAKLEARRRLREE